MCVCSEQRVKAGPGKACAGKVISAYDCGWMLVAVAIDTELSYLSF